MKYFKFIILFFFIYLFLVFPFIGKPLVVDEVYFAALAGTSWLKLGPYPSFPFYIDILKFFSQVFGVDGSNLRIVGILCFLLNLILIYQISCEIFKDRARGILASFIFALHPLAIQGSMMLDYDTTILTVILMLTCLFYVKNSDRLNLKHSIYLTLLFFACLWVKLGTPIILMASLILFIFLKKDKIRTIQIFFISLASVLIFLIAWKIYSVIFNFPFSIAFKRGLDIIIIGLQKGSLPAMQELVLRILRVSLWLGPYLIVFWIVDVAKRIKIVFIKKEQLNFNDFLIIYSVCIFIFYILVGGLSFGFPKYHYPLLPILSIIIANAILSLDLKNFKRYFILYGLLGFIFLIISNVFTGDLLYQINYILRKIAIFSPEELPDFYRDFVIRIIFYSLPFIVSLFLIRLIIRKESWLKIFSFLAITFIILNSLSFDIQLRNKNYFTTYCYGREIEEFQNVVKLFKDIIEKDRNAIVIVPRDILYAAIGVDPVFEYNMFWNDKDNFLKAIKDKRTRAVIYHFAYNSVLTYRKIFRHPAVKAVFENEYMLIPAGHYTFWLRK